MTAFSPFLPSLVSAISFICIRQLAAIPSLPTPSGGFVVWRGACLEEDHGRDLLGGEGLLLAEILNLNSGLAIVIDDLERPGLNVLLDGGVIEAATDQTPRRRHKKSALAKQRIRRSRTHLASKTVLAGFMAALFLAASPIRRSLSVKETKEGVVKEPCSLAMISTLLPS
jgi:hypothetical protein